MKSNKIFSILLLSLSAFMASCSKDGAQPIPSEQHLPLEQISFSAELPDPAESAMGEDGARTMLDTDGNKVKWTLGDKISVFSNKDPKLEAKEFSATQVVEREATFEGEAVDSPVYFAMYPHSATNKFNSYYHEFTTALKTEQSAVLGSFADDTSIAVARLDNYNEKTNRRFKFRNATGLLKIEFSLDASLAGKEITEIRLMAKADANGNRPKLSGKALVSLGNSNIRPKTRIDAATGMPYISLTNGGAAIAPTSGGKGYYMVVPTEGIGQSFLLVFIASDGTGIVKTFETKTAFSSNKIKTVQVKLNQLEAKHLTNVPLLDAIEKNIMVQFEREGDRTSNYFRNIDPIERAIRLNTQNNNELNSLRELEYYTNLKEVILNRVPNLKGALEIHNNPKLTNINIQNTGITSAHIDNVENLTATLGLANNPELSTVKVISSKLTSVSAPGTPKLKTLDLSEVPSLTYVEAYNSGLEYVDLSKNPALQGVNFHAAKLQSLDVTHNPALTNLVASYNSIKSLDLSKNPLLNNLNVHANQLTSLDLSNNRELVGLVASNNRLQGTLDLSNNAKLESINLHYNGTLEGITLPSGSRLKALGASFTSLKMLDVSTAKELTSIEVGSSRPLARIIGLEQLPKLEVLSVYITSLEELNVSANPLLKKLDVYGSRLSVLDITKNPLLMREKDNFLYVGTQTSNGSLARTITVTMTVEQAKVFDQDWKAHSKNKDNVAIQVQ